MFLRNHGVRLFQNERRGHVLCSCHIKSSRLVTHPLNASVPERVSLPSDKRKKKRGLLRKMSTIHEIPIIVECEHSRN